MEQAREQAHVQNASIYNKPLDHIKRFLIYAVLIAGAVLILLPFAWTFSTSLKPPDQVFTFPPQWIPDPIRWANYPEALSIRPFGRWFLNTVLIVGLSTFGILASTSMVAFSFARLRWPGRDILFLVLLATMMLPGQVTLIPTFILFREFGWVNSYWPLILPPFLARNAFYVFLLRQFYMTIPLDLDDAARLDGANNFQIYWRIILPMSKPALAVAGIMFAQFKWKEFLGPLIYLNNPDLYTIALGLKSFIGRDGDTDWHLMMAANIVFMIPLIVVFFFLQKYFIQGIVVTGVKG